MLYGPSAFLPIAVFLALGINGEGRGAFLANGHVLLTYVYFSRNKVVGTGTAWPRFSLIIGGGDAKAWDKARQTDQASQHPDRSSGFYVRGQCCASPSSRHLRAVQSLLPTH